MSKANGLPRGISIRRGKYFVDILVKGERFYGTFEDFETARLHCDEWKKGRLTSARHAGKTEKESVDNPVWTLGKAYEVTKLRRWSGTKSERAALINARIVLEHFGLSVRLDAITAEAIDGFIDAQKAQGKANGTINRKLAALSAMFKVALQRGGCLSKPVIPHLREPKGRIRYLSREEEALVLQTLRLWGKTDHYDATVCLLDTGMRTGELWKLKASNIHLKQGTYGIIVLYGDDTKNGATRSIPMTSRTRKILVRRMSEAPEGEPLFPESNNFWYLRVWDRVAVHIGKDDDPFWVPHILRHTCCSRLVQGGLDMRKVQEWMGHKTIITTQRYAHLSPTDLYKGVDILENL